MISVALFFAGMALGIALAYALIRVEGSAPCPSPRRPGLSSSSSRAPRVGALSHPSNVRRVPRWEQDYAAEYLDRVRREGQDVADGRA